MMYLRALYMIIGWIVLLPLVSVIYLGWFIFVLCVTKDLKISLKNTKNAFIKSVYDNLDFVKNGL